jgi:hypothetical protein
MFGLGMGLNVESNQRLVKARELRQRELKALEAPRVIKGSTPWIPPKSRK